MDLERARESVIAEGQKLRKTPLPAQTRAFQHRDVTFRISGWKKLKAAIRNVRHNPNELLHYIFKIPYCGYVLHLISCVLRLPVQLRKLREEIASLHQHLADMESRIAGTTAAELDRLNQRITKIELQASTSPSPEVG